MFLTDGAGRIKSLNQCDLKDEMECLSNKAEPILYILFTYLLKSIMSDVVYQQLYVVASYHHLRA